MVRRATILERRWPETPQFSRLADDWSQKASTVLLDYVWRGCDALCAEDISKIGGATSNDLSLERSITQLLIPKIRKAMPSESPFQVEHEVFEFESLAAPQAEPPRYDIGFTLNENPRLIWPIEAKVLPKEDAIGEYVKEVTGNFMTCRYGPFSSEGGMLGYLLSGSPEITLNNISIGLDCNLSYHPSFLPRNHRTSHHARKVPPGKAYPERFRCHHMIVQVGPLPS